jgi:hypothetical protein
MGEKGIGTVEAVAITVGVVVAVVVVLLCVILLLPAPGPGENVAPTVPLYPGAVRLEAVEEEAREFLENLGVVGFELAAYSVPATPSTVYAWYLEEMPQHGWTIENSLSSPDNRSHALVCRSGNEGAIVFTSTHPEHGNMLGIITGSWTVCYELLEIYITYVTYAITYAPPPTLAAFPVLTDTDDIGIEIIMATDPIAAEDWEYAVTTTPGLPATWSAGTQAIGDEVETVILAADQPPGTYYVWVRHKPTRHMWIDGTPVTVPVAGTLPENVENVEYQLVGEVI